MLIAQFPMNALLPSQQDLADCDADGLEEISLVTAEVETSFLGPVAHRYNPRKDFDEVHDEFKEDTSDIGGSGAVMEAHALTGRTILFRLGLLGACLALLVSSIVIRVHRLAV